MSRLMKFDDFIFSSHPDGACDKVANALFNNGLGVSIVQGGMAMTDDDGEWELAPIKRVNRYPGYVVLNGRDERVNDLVDKWVAKDPERLGEGKWVLSHLTPDEVTAFLADIQELTINDGGDDA